MNILPVKVNLGETFNAEKLEEIKPDVVILATGAKEFIPQIKGISADNVVTALDVLKKNVSVGDNVVVVGGGLIGVETADFLAKQGKQVIVFEMLKSIG